MTQKILVTRPKMDRATDHTYYWAERLVMEAKGLQYNIIDYRERDTEYEKVSKALLDYNPDVYIHFGHGCPSSLIGQKTCIITNGTKNFDYTNPNYLDKYTYRMGDDIVCDSLCGYMSNVNLLKGKIVIAYACHSSKKLGICAMEKGAKAYIGFDDYLIFMVDTKQTENIFIETFLTFSNSFLNGDTLKMAREKTLLKFNENIREYKHVKYLARLLMWNRMAFKVYGDDNLTIFS